MQWLRNASAFSKGWKYRWKYQPSCRQKRAPAPLQAVWLPSHTSFPGPLASVCRTPTWRDTFRPRCQRKDKPSNLIWSLRLSLHTFSFVNSQLHRNVLNVPNCVCLGVQIDGWTCGEIGCQKNLKRKTILESGLFGHSMSHSRSSSL